MPDPTSKTKKNVISLRPAFGTQLQAITFVLVVASALLLPIAIRKSGLLTPKASYEVIPERLGAYSFIGNEIFEKNGDLDILFVGSSILWNAIDTPQVQRALTARLGRPATAATFGFNFNSLDIPFTMLSDLLKRRRVRLVVFSIPRLPYTDGPSTTAYRFLRPGENESLVRHLPVESQISLYGSGVLRSPRDVLSLIRPNRSQQSAYAADLGANKELMGMYRDTSTYTAFAPKPPVLSASDLLFATNPKMFRITNDPIPEHQDRYLSAIIELLEEHGVPIAFLSVPQYSERDHANADERFDWSKRFKKDIPLIGISPPVLFAGLNDEEIEKLHCDREHFNKNGNEFFTVAVMPGILSVYDKYANKTF